jgi:ferredoxin-type protein NapH
MFFMQDSPKTYSVKKSLLLTLPMIALSLVSIFIMEPTDTRKIIPLIIAAVFCNSIFFLILRTGKIDKYRAIIFITMAVTFPVSFILDLFEERGHFMILTFEDMLACATPFCHIGVPQTLLTVVTKKVAIFPGDIETIGEILITWLAITLLLGKGFCSWGCFWGGWEDGFSRIKKKPVIARLNDNLKYIPFAVLLAVVLTSTLTLSPQYCWWLCPFKAVSEFVEVSTLKVIIQTAIFVFLFIVLVIVLPLLTKKRTQCTFLCPFGAMQSLTNKISPFDVRIDKSKCVKCRHCIKSCPILSLDEKSLETGKPGITCVKCGKCIDACPRQAISYHIKGTAVGLNTNGKRLFYLYPAFFLLSLLGIEYISGALYRILLFVTTGSFIN